MNDAVHVLSLAEVKAFLKLSGTDKNRDTWLTREVTSQLEVIGRYLERPVVVQQFQDNVDGTGERILKLESTPVQSVISLSIDNDRYFRETSQVGASQFIVDEDTIELRYDVFPYGHRNIRIHYIAGYADIEIPFSQRRFDFREASGGDLLTVYLPVGRWRPTELAEMLERELNAVGESERTVAFDWGHRRFVITQPDSDFLQIVSSETGTFKATESATGLLGFQADATLTDGEMVGSAVTLFIPEVIKSAALELVAIQFVQSSFGENRYGLRSYRLADYQVQYDTGNENTMHTVSGIPPKLEQRLQPFKNWNLF